MPLPLLLRLKLLLSSNLPRIQNLVAILLRAHLAIFYFSGVYYEPAKRVVGIKYVRTLPYNSMFYAHHNRIIAEHILRLLLLLLWQLLQSAFLPSLTGIDQIFNRKLFETRPKYHLLGLLLLIQLGVSAAQFLREKFVRAAEEVRSLSLSVAVSVPCDD
jgi:hypothetical protein